MGIFTEITVQGKIDWSKRLLESDDMPASNVTLICIWLKEKNTLGESSSAFVQDDDTWCWAGEFDKQKLWCRFLNFSQSSKMMMMTMLMMMISPSQRWQWWWWRVWQTKLWGATSSISHSRKHLPAAPRGDSAKRFASDTFSFSKLEKFWKFTPNVSL